MRTIREDEELNTLVKVGDIVRLEGFTDEPVIAVVTGGSKSGDCSGCAIESDVSCAVYTMDNKGEPVRISPCCLRASWMGRKGIPIFGKFIRIDEVLEEL